MNKKIFLAQDTIEQSELNNLSEWLKTSQRLTKGPLCNQFEEKFSKWQGSNYSIFVKSGSSANLLMIYSLLEGGYLKNKKAIAPAVSWVTTVSPLMQLGFDTKLCDCDEDDLGLDLNHFEDLCKKHQPSIAILVHVLGHANKMEQIMKICDKYGVTLIEDSCEALGSKYQDKKLGSISKAGSFSFYYGHHISTIEGGMVVTDDEKLYNLMLSIRSHGWSRDVSQEYRQEWQKDYDIDEVRNLYTFYYPGFNLRSSDLNAFIGLSQIDKIDELAKKRQENFNLYKDNLSNFWHQKSDSSFLSSFAYGTLVKNRLEVYNHLKKHDIESRPLICGNIGLHPFWIKKYGPTSLKIADQIHKYGIYLPNHGNLELDDIDYICDSFKNVAQNL